MKKNNELNTENCFEITGYSGICAACFCPIACGDEALVRKGGRHFHKSCIERYPNNYYVKLERSLLKRQQTNAAKVAAAQTVTQTAPRAPATSSKNV